MAVFAYVGLSNAICVWLYRAVYGYLGLCVALYGYVRLCRAMYGCLWLCMGMSS